MQSLVKYLDQMTVDLVECPRIEQYPLFGCIGPHAQKLQTILQASMTMKRIQYWYCLRHEAPQDNALSVHIPQCYIIGIPERHALLNRTL